MSTRPVPREWRRVEANAVAAGLAVVVTSGRTIDAEPTEVWRACASPERLNRWFGAVEADPRVGGSFAVGDDVAGRIEECYPPEHLVVSWECGGDVGRVTVRVAPGTWGPDGGAVLTVTQVGTVSRELFLRYGPCAAGVAWDIAGARLAEHLVDREFDAFSRPASPIGRDAVARWSEAWAVAAVEAGMRPHHAPGVVARTTALHLGRR